MLKIEYFDKYNVSTLSNFLEQSIAGFQERHGVFLTVHAMSGRWYGANGTFLFSKWMAHRAEYCSWKRYTYKKYDKACLRDCAAGVEQESLRTGLPFQHTCWKGVTELVVPFVWDGVLELIFYIGPFRSSEQPEEELRPEWEKLPEFPREKLNLLITESLQLGLAFYARLMQENRKKNQIPDRRDIIREYILCHGCEEITLSGLASHLGVSISRASHLCIKLLGMPFQMLVLNVRMKKAEFLLQETDEPIKEIAVKSGFSNVYYFSRMFRRFFNETPARFRAADRNKNNNKI